MRPASTRYPYADLERLLGGKSRKAQTRLLGVDSGQLYREIASGLTFLQAERFAEAAGFLPYEVWPAWLDESIARATVDRRACEADGCDTTFEVSPFGRGGKGRRFCSDTCCSRMSMRRYRATDRGRQANREYLARYRLEVAAAKTRRAIRAAAITEQAPDEEAAA